MRYRAGICVLSSALVLGLAVGGCNIFGSEERQPGSKAEALQTEVADFLATGSTATISSSTLLDAAKESRAKADIGILQITRELSQPSTSTSLQFPFESLNSGTRAQNLEHLRRMDQALALILFANKVGGGKPAQGDVPDQQLQLAASRVKLATGIDPCSVYPDFIIVRLLKVMTDFRVRLDGIDANNLEVIGVAGGYRIRWKGTTQPTQTQKNQINSIIDWLAHPTTGVLTTQVKPIFDPVGMFGCESPLSEIIDFEKVQNYIDNTLAASLRASKF